MKFKVKDKDIQLIVGQLLRYGVFAASGIVLLGGLYYIYMYGGNDIPKYHTFSANADKILLTVKQFNAAAFIELGILVLIATPILRVVFSLIAFAMERDRLYVMITLIVLSIILFNIIYGIEG